MNQRLLFLTVAVTGLVAACASGQGVNAELIPPQLAKDQRDRLLSFLEKNHKADRFIPADAKVVGEPAALGELTADAKPSPVKQYTVQITPHRPVPGQDRVSRVDVFYFRYHPEKGKPGITVKRTVDVGTGDQVGPPEVLLNRTTPLAREELAEAVALAKEFAAIRALYKAREKGGVRYDYLQLLIQKKHAGSDPGDRAVRFVFTAKPLEGEKAPPPVPVVVNLTKGTVRAEGP